MTAEIDMEIEEVVDSIVEEAVDLRRNLDPVINASFAEAMVIGKY
jgi:hypothetical protein